MAAILIDYENVRDDGLYGTEYLTADDTLYLFYSGACQKIKKCFFDNITTSGCNFHAVKLARQGKNGLDFYIASECGVLAEAGERKIVIISKDKGFGAVVDFFQRSEYKTFVTIGRNITDGITKLNLAGRSDTLRDGSQQLDLEKEYKKYEKAKAEKERVKEIFAETEYAPRTDDIVVMLETPGIKKSPRALYLECMHRFGLNSGREIYRALKEE